MEVLSESPTNMAKPLWASLPNTPGGCHETSTLSYAFPVTTGTNLTES